MKKIMRGIVIAAALASSAFQAEAETFRVVSPDKSVEAVLTPEKGNFNVTILYKGKVVVKDAVFAVATENARFGGAPAPYSLDRRYRHNAADPKENFNQIEFNATDLGYRFIMRAYDDAFACRFYAYYGAKTFDVYEDIVKITPAEGGRAVVGKTVLAEISAGGARAIFAESENGGYPALALKADKNALVSNFKKLKNPASDEPDIAAQPAGRARLPWRFFAFASDNETPASVDSVAKRLSEKNPEPDTAKLP